MKKVFNGIIKYLSEWKNWLVHALVGIALLVMVIFIPVIWWVKLIIIAVVVALNSLRMVLEKKRKESKN